jgi:hypothetical protein
VAVIKTFEPRPDGTYCLLIDPQADTVEVVGPRGMDADGLEFTPSYYEEVPTGAHVAAIMVRVDAATGLPVGLMLERFSQRDRRKGHRSWRIGPRTTDLQALEGFIEVAVDAIRSVTDPDEPELFEEAAPMPTLRRNNGGWLLEPAAR